MKKKRKKKNRATVRTRKISSIVSVKAQDIDGNIFALEDIDRPRNHFPLGLFEP